MDKPKTLKIFRMELSLYNLQSNSFTKSGRPYVLLKVDDKNVYLLQCYSVKDKKNKKSSKKKDEKNKEPNKKLDGRDYQRFFIKKNKLFLLKTLNKETYVLLNQILIINKKELPNLITFETIPNFLSKQLWNQLFDCYKHQKYFALLMSDNKQLIHLWVSNFYYKEFEKNNLEKRKAFEDFIKLNNIEIDLTYEDVDELLDFEFSKISIDRKLNKHQPDKSKENEKIFLESLTETELKIYMSGRNGFGGSGEPSGNSMRLKSEFEEFESNNKKEENKDEKENNQDDGRGGIGNDD